MLSLGEHKSCCFYSVALCFLLPMLASARASQRVLFFILRESFPAAQIENIGGSVLAGRRGMIFSQGVRQSPLDQTRSRKGSGKTVRKTASARS